MISFVVVALLLLKFTEATIFNGSCSSYVGEKDNQIGYSFRPILLMSGNSSRNHMFRNFFGHTPECWEFSVMDNGDMFTRGNILIDRNEYSYPFIERSSCDGVVQINDQIFLNISKEKLSFMTFKPKIFNIPLPMMCKSEHNWRSNFHIKMQTLNWGNIDYEKYIVLWSCEELQDDQYDLGILVGLSSRILQNATALIYERNRILETSLELVKSLPFAENFTMKDFQKAHLHDGVQCDICEVFECN